jgi:predicted GIY-YIG superfamily endonuclease
VVHVEFYGSKEEAMKREKYLKRGRGVEEKRRIIED